MDIGILTFYSSQDNYGQTLQLYALQQVLKSMGHSPELIRIPELPDPSEVTFKVLLKRFVKKVLKKLKKRKVHLNKTNLILPDRNFDSFKAQYINTHPIVFNYEELYESPPQKTCFIVGSDQVWSLGAKQFFLDWVTSGIKVSYAASFGGFRLPRENRRFYRIALNNFDHISVREQDGIRFCKEVDIDNVEVVLDPTLLLDKSHYETLIQSNLDRTEKSYILIYLIGWKIEFDISKIYEWAQNNGYEVKYVASQGRNDDYEKVYPTIPEWLGLIRNAEYVITNSFHGTVFSILMEKEFLVLPLSQYAAPMNNRLKELLYPLGLEDRLYWKSMDSFKNKIKYDEVKRLLDKKIQKSYEWLENAVGNNKMSRK